MKKCSLQGQNFKAFKNMDKPMKAPSNPKIDPPTEIDKHLSR